MCSDHSIFLSVNLSQAGRQRLFLKIKGSWTVRVRYVHEPFLDFGTGDALIYHYHALISRQAEIQRPCGI